MFSITATFMTYVIMIIGIVDMAMIIHKRSQISPVISLYDVAGIHQMCPPFTNDTDIFVYIVNNDPMFSYGDAVMLLHKMVTQTVNTVY